MGWRSGVAAGTLLLVLLAGGQAAAEAVDICYNYGCKVQQSVHLSSGQLQQVGRYFTQVADARSERRAVALAVGELARLIGRETPIHNDRGDNGGMESGVEGRMDCYDHAATTTSYLQMMARQGWLRFHDVGHFVERAPLIFNYHRSAHLIERGSAAEYVVDNWFFDNGHPAVVFGLSEWLAGAWPDDLPEGQVLAVNELLPDSLGGERPVLVAAATSTPGKTVLSDAPRTAAPATTDPYARWRVYELQP